MKHPKLTRLFWLLVPLIGIIDQSIARAESFDDITSQLQSARGLCVLVGIDSELIDRLANREDRLVHCLGINEQSIDRQLRALAAKPPAARVIVERWRDDRLPYVDHLVNLVLVSRPNLATRGEVERVLRPGGVALFREGSQWVQYVKPPLHDTDEWTHQWHSTDGGLTTEDRRVDVPTGVQWIAGPLFAMAGRKSSTQSLVTSSGINFYVTQNVLENVGKPIEAMDQYLVARDSFNGLVLWQRPWTGPFVTGNGETNPRMIASPERLYAVAENQQLVALDPRTGASLARFVSDSPVDKIVLVGGTLFVQSPNQVRAVSANLSQQLWRFEGRNLSGLTVVNDRAFLLDSGRSSDGQFRHELICLDASDGSAVYRENTQPHVTSARVRINFVQDGLVALQAHGFLHLFDAASGQHLWSRSTEARPGKTYVDERYVGHFYRNGLVWMLLQNSPRESEGQNVWHGLNPRTGELVRELPTQGSWPRTATPAKMGCQVLIASDRYIMIPRQSTFIDLNDGTKHSFKFTRGGCGLGFVPANGLVYSHPHACGCFSEAMRGFMGMHSDDLDEILKSSSADDSRLTFHVRPSLSEPASIGQWALHRADATRGAAVDTELAGVIEPQWRVRIASKATPASSRSWRLRNGNRLTASTIAFGMVCVADVDAGRLIALDQRTGRRLWEFSAAGRIDSPPTLWRGLCLFGSHDGFVYCLEAESGRLNWKYRAAPAERRIVAFGGLQSAWPVAGTALVRDGVVFAAAGQAPDADSGIEVVALKVETGEPLWHRRISGGSYRGLCDFLIGDEQGIFLSNLRFDLEEGEIQEVSAESPHLTGGKVGLLEASWSKHDLALRKDIQTWTARGISGQLLAFSDEAKVAWHAESGVVTIETDHQFTHTIDKPEQVTALALTRNHAILAGGLDRADVQRGGFVRLLDLDTGRIVASQTLTAEAVFDGVSVAGSTILVSTQDGHVYSFNASR